MREEVTDPSASGRFDIPVVPDAGIVDLVILPRAPPVKLLSIPVHRDVDPSVEIVVGGPAGVLEIEMDDAPPFPLIGRHARTVYATILRYPHNWTSPAPDRRRWGLAVYIEARSRRGSTRFAPAMVKGVVRT